MRVLATRRDRRNCLSKGQMRPQVCDSAIWFGLLIGIALPAAAQEQPFSHIDDDLMHLTPVSRNLDYIRFLPSLGALKPTRAHTELFYFDRVLLPSSTWMDDAPDNSAKRHPATASDIRHSVIPQTNRHGTLSFLLNGNGETPLDSEEGQTEFRSNGPTLPDSATPDAEIEMSGSWLALPVILMLSQAIARLNRWTRRDSEA